MKTVIDPKLCQDCRFCGDTLQSVKYVEVPQGGVTLLVKLLMTDVECARRDCDNWRDAPIQRQEVDYATPND